MQFKRKYDKIGCIPEPHLVLSFHKSFKFIQESHQATVKLTEKSKCSSGLKEIMALDFFNKIN